MELPNSLPLKVEFNNPRKVKNDDVGRWDPSAAIGPSFPLEACYISTATRCYVFFLGENFIAGTAFIATHVRIA